MITLGLTVFFIAVVGFSALLGLIRGMNKSVIRLMTLVLAVVLTFVLAGPITRLIAGNILIDGKNLGELALEALSSADTAGALLDAAPLLQEAILVAPAMLLAIAVFPLVFLVLRFLTWIVFLFIQRPLRRLIFKDSCRKEDAAAAPMGVRVGKRFAGLGIGIVAGVLIFGMLLTPLFGFFTVLPGYDALDHTMDTLVQQEQLSATDADMMMDAYGITESGLVKFYGFIGLRSAGRAYLNGVSRIEADGMRTSLTDEFGALMNVAQTAVEGGLLDALNSKDDPNAIYGLLSDKVFMDKLMKDMFRSKLLRAAVPEIMAVAMESVAKSMDVPMDKEAVYNKMMDAVAQAIKDADIDYAAIEAYEKANSADNAQGRNAGEPNEDAIMTQEEYEAELRKLEKLEEKISGILNKSIAGDHADFTDSVARQIVGQVRTQAVEKGQESLASYDAAGVQSALSNVNAGSDSELLQQLTDPERFETDMATVETITESVRNSVKEALADDDQAAETAGTLANVVSDFAGAISSAMDANGELDATKLDFGKVASAVTTLQNSSLKGVGSSVLDVVASGSLGEDNMIGNVMSAVKEGYENGEDVGATINTAGALINLGAAMGNENGADQESMVNSMTSLINNLNDFTIGLLPDIMSEDTIVSMGVPREYADETYNVIETLLKELMKLKGAENYDNEVDAVLSLYNLATSGVDKFKSDDIAKLADCAVESEAVYNTLMSVSTSNPFGIQIKNEADRTELIDGIQDNYAASGKTQREWDVYNAIAKILGLDGEVELER